MSTQHKKVYSGKFTSSCLETGGAFSGGDRSQPLTVDKCNAQRQFKKPVGKGSEGALNSFNMFKPLSVNATSGKRKPADSKAVYTDPFAADRPHYQPPVKKLIDMQRNAEPEPATRKHVTSATKDGQHKEKLITANGLVGGGGKHFDKGKHTSRTTFDKEDPKGKINYAEMSRFKSSAAARTEHGTQGPISPNNGDVKNFPDSASPSSRPCHGGIKRVDGAPDTSNSLAGVLRMGAAKQGRSYTYRPPWGTCNTPRTPAPSNGGRYQSNTTGNAPFATSHSAVLSAE